MKKVFSFLLGLIMLGLLGWGLWEVINWYLSIIKSLDKQVAAAIIAASTTVLVSVLSLILAKYFENNPNFGGEAKDNEPQKLTIGVFRDYWEADTFKKYMREMGVKDAWIVPYQDGQRVEIKDVLEGVVADKPSPNSK